MAIAINLGKLNVARTVVSAQAGFWCAALDGPGKRLFLGGTDSHIHVYDLPGLTPATPAKEALLKAHASYVTALAYEPVSRALISGSYDRQLIWWKQGGGMAPVRVLSLPGRVNALAVSGDGRLLATATDDLVGRLWEAASGRLLHELHEGHPPATRIGRKNTLYAAAIRPDGRVIATGDRAGTIALWDAASGRKLPGVDGKVFYSQALYRDANPRSEYEWGGVRCLAFTPDGKLLVAGGMGPADQNSAGIDGPMCLEIFDAGSGKSLASFTNASKGMLTAVAFQPGGDWLAAAGGGGKAGSSGVGSLWLWNYRQRAADGKLVPPIAHPSPIVIRGLAFAPDGKHLLAAGMLNDLTAGRIEAWDLTGAVSVPVSGVPVKK